jgi:hypothetical protein
LRIMQAVFDNPEFVFSLAAIFILVVHFFGRIPGMMLFLIALLLLASGLIFIVLSHTPEPIGFPLVVATLILYSAALFVLLSEIMLAGLAKFLTAKRGERWVKELDYVYLTIGAVGIVASMNRIEFLTGRFERADILAPLILATAVVIRFVKTRAEIGDWNKRT